MYIIFTIETMALFSYFYSARPSGVFGPSCLKQQQDWRVLEHVSQEMKGDRELCTAAVTDLDFRTYGMESTRPHP